MKTAITLLTCLLLTISATLSQAQTLRRVSKNGGVSGPNTYSTIQAAHDASVNGDIIYVEPCEPSDSYGDLACVKRLTFYGNGFYLTDNRDLNGLTVPYDTRRSNLGNVTFNRNGGQSRMVGLFMGSLTINAPTITADRCLILNVNLGVVGTYPTTYSFGDNATITRSIIQNGLNSTQYVQISSAPDYRSISGLVFRNNIVWNNSITHVSNAIISNNIFQRLCTIFTNIDVSSITNNIFYTDCTGDVNAKLLAPDCFGNSFAYNISSSDKANYIPSGNGNQNLIDPTTLFVNNFPGSSGQYDGAYQLSAGSPARGAGLGGTDCGVFGGARPYVLGAIPAIPFTTQYLNSGAGNSTTPLQVTISAQSNN